MYSPMQLAEAFIQAGELTDALDALNQADPTDAEARRLRASVLMRLPGRLREALADLDALAAPTAEDHLTRAHLLEQLGDDPGAFAAVEQAWRSAPDARITEQYVRALMQRGAADQALRALADQPEGWRWSGWRGDCYALQRDFGAAVTHYSAALDQLAALPDPNGVTETQTAHLLFKRAQAYQNLQQVAAAEADYQAAEAIIPDDPMIPFNRGLLIFEQGDLRRALPFCRDALDRAPEALRDHIRDVLFGDPRYHLLAQALLS